MDNSKIPWQRLAVEMPIIVFSILLAFAIDAWWDDRRERASERVLLERLQSPMWIERLLWYFSPHEPSIPVPVQ